MRLTEGLGRDVRQAWRLMVRNKASTLASLLVVGVGVGLAAAMFAITDPYVNAALPYRHSSQLVVISVGRDGLTRGSRVPTLDDWRQRRDVFEDLAAVEAVPIARDCASADGPLRMVTQGVSDRFLSTLGVAESTWSWTPATNAADGLPVVLTPAGRARLFFPSDREAIGQTLSCGQLHLRIVGVLPVSFRFPDVRRPGIDALLPYMPDSVADIRHWDANGHGAVWEGSPTIIARLMAGQRPDTLASTLGVGSHALSQASIRVRSLADEMTLAYRPLALGALAISLLVMVVSTGNFANLLAVRIASRSPELATRAALGASAWHLIRVVLVELSVLGAGAAASGLIVALVAVAAIRSAMPASYLAVAMPVVDARAAAFCLATTAGLLIVGAFPAFAYITRRHFSQAAQVTFGETRRRRAIRVFFMSVQSALAMVLILGTMLVAYSYLNIVRQRPGVDPATVVIDVSVPISASSRGVYRDIESVLTTSRQLLPGESIAATDAPIVDDGLTAVGVEINGEVTGVNAKSVSPGFFVVTNIPMLEGRELLPAAGDAEIVVSRSMAARWWPGRSPLGEVVVMGSGRGTHARVVGVAEDMFDRAWDAAPQPTLYAPFDVDRPTPGFRFVARGRATQRDLLATIRRVLLTQNPDLVVTGAGTVASRLAQSVADRTFVTVVMVAYALAATGIALLGITGVVAFTVSRRTREIAVRVALGASPRHILALVTREAAGAVVYGALAGILIGRLSARMLAAFAYGVEPGSWGYVLTGTLGLVIFAAAAAFLAASDAQRLSPTAALRLE
ncbi:MAG: FtsX-like permease family protein [Acidobacteriota bacterium]